jgi:hypothetical protein
MLELILGFLGDIVFYKLGCWSLRRFSMGHFRWDDNGQRNPYWMSLLGFLVFVLFLVMSYFLIKTMRGTP